MNVGISLNNAWRSDSVFDFILSKQVLLLSHIKLTARQPDLESDSKALKIPHLLLGNRC